MQIAPCLFSSNTEHGFQSWVEGKSWWSHSFQGKGRCRAWLERLRWEESPNRNDFRCLMFAVFKKGPLRSDERCLMFVVFKKGPLRSDKRAWYLMEKEDTDCTRALIIYVVKNWVHQLDILNSWHQTTDLAVITLPPKPEVTKRSGCRHSLLPQCLVSQIYADAHSSGQGCNYIYQTPAFFFFHLSILSIQTKV